MAEEIIIKTVLDLSGSEQVIKRQVEKALGGRESAETRHQRRIEALTLQHANRLQQIESRKQSQIDAIRERGLQKELEHQRKIERETQRAANAFSSMRTAIAGVAGIFTVLAGSGALSFFENLARRAIDAAVAIDRQVNTLKALTGSAEAATRRFGELFALAQKTPGLTTNLALTLDTQLRILNVTEQTINKILPAIGRLNAIAPLGDPSRFVGNLGQLITQRFEVQDLRELVGNSPFAGEIIKSLFGVNSPTNAKAIREAARKLGIDTVEEFMTAFAETAEKDPRLRAITESLGAQFEKLQDRIQVALAPVGDELLKTILPAFREFVELLERDLPKVTALLRDNRDEFLAVAGAIAFMTEKVGQLIGALARFQVAENLSAIRLLSILGVSLIGGPSAGITAGRAFVEADAQRARVTAKLPFGMTIDEMVSGIKSPASFKPPPPPPSGLENAETQRVARERARELEEARKNSARALDEFMKGNIEDLEQISKIINQSNATGEERRRQIEGRPAQLARFGAAQDERIRQIELESLRLEQNTAKEAARAQKEFNEELKKSAEIAREFDPAFRFMRGLAGETDATASAFERLGQSIGDAFGDLSNLLSNLGAAVKRFFGDLLSATIRTTLATALGPLFGGGGGGILGNLFRTPSFAGGGGISAPPSVSGGGLGGLLSGIFNRGGGSAQSGASRIGTVTLDEPFESAAAGRAAGGFNLSGLGQSAATALSAVGFQLGVSLGGKSTAGKILGGIGGGLGITSVLAAPLFAIGALLGSGKQRRSDEEASGQFLTQAIQGIQELAAGVSSGQIAGTQANAIFETQILGTFQQQIGQLKTRSVRESRLTNQVNDLRKMYRDLVEPAIAAANAQQLRLSENADRFSRQVPEFATGGTTRGGLALLHPGEKVLNMQQQAAVISQSNPRVFENAGVPGPSQNRVFDIGGTMSAGQWAAQPIEIALQAQVVIGKDDATRIVVVGASSSQGRAVLVKNINVARTDGDL